MPDKRVSGAGVIGGRPPITLGVSLKLYLDVDSTVAWASAIADLVRTHPAVVDGKARVFVMPSVPALSQVSEAIGDAPMALGAQDLFWEDRGAFTGAVSGADLVGLGCEYVEVGHVERREIFGEGEDVTRRKFAAATRNGLTPVLCVGESHASDVDDAVKTCIAQFESALAGIEEGTLPRLVVAYEPEWAIGAVEPAPPEHVVAVVDRLRARIAQTPGLIDGVVIYGGSAKPGLLSKIGDCVDGLFLGRFAHDPAAFARILDEVAVIK